MKDITITGLRIKKEIIIAVVSLLAAIILNIFSIAKFKTDWSELFGQLHVVILVAIAIYILVLIFRLIFWGIAGLIQKK